MRTLATVALTVLLVVGGTALTLGAIAAWLYLIFLTPEWLLLGVVLAIACAALGMGLWVGARDCWALACRILDQRRRWP